MGNNVVDEPRQTFSRIEHTTIADQVRDQLMDSIRDGRFGPGSKIPAERQLCDEFGVARTTVREAIQQLISLGVVERRNSRLFVVEYLGVVAVPADGLKRQVRELFETRRIIEISMTGLAALHATDAQRSDINDLAAEFRRGMDLREFRDLDHRFHAAIAAACGNPLLAELYGRVLRALFESPAFASLLYTSANRNKVDEIINRSAEGHDQIAAAISTGDEQGAALVAGEHLAEVERRMLSQLI
ncbi:MAG: FadR family transcriptional regulator [Acidimicrobiia bacterium]|nr:FadR family transcriptional regulator [Actinomycetota bacterium]MBL6923900.1 FadR family transcriptional regulator [Acidimicrobiia bacterium]MBL6926391.1 FadR family transcriptional regulator [Acidimicrobiia bacterium]